MAHQRAAPNHYLSELIASRFEAGYIGHAVDVGASDGVSVNTTYGLEKLRRWTVLSVEPNPEFWPVLTSERAFVEKCACSNFTGTATLHVNIETPEAYSNIVGEPDIKEFRHDRGVEPIQWREVEVRVEQVDDLLAKWRFPKLDALCVDVEGHEREVLDGVNLEVWKPKVVILESWEPHLHDVYMSERGYRPKQRLVHNEVFEREDK